MPRVAPLSWHELTPESRARIEEGLASGMYAETESMRVIAQSPEALAAMHDSYKAVFGRSVLGTRLQELLRIRSAQLNGCDLCAGARKSDSLTDSDVACMLANDGEEFALRERLALRFLTLMATDHHRIDSKLFRELADHFDAREIVELGWFCGNCIGTHRFMHAIDMLGDEPPIVGGKT